MPCCLRSSQSRAPTDAPGSGGLLEHALLVALPVLVLLVRACRAASCPWRARSRLSRAGPSNTWLWRRRCSPSCEVAPNRRAISRLCSSSLRSRVGSGFTCVLASLSGRDVGIQQECLAILGTRGCPRAGPCRRAGPSLPSLRARSPPRNGLLGGSRTSLVCSGRWCCRRCHSFSCS